MNIAKFSVKNSVLVNLLMIGLFFFGFISLKEMPTELNPEISFNWVFINVLYPGASPHETESLIIDPIESEIYDVEGIDEIQSTAGESFGMVMVKFEDMSDSEFREKLTDLKAEIDKVTFPDEAESPNIESFGSGDFMPVITINMAYDIPLENALLIADNIKDELEEISGVAKIQVSGLAEREIWVEVDPEKMTNYGITFDQIVMAVKARNMNIPGGTISIGKTEYLIRSVGEYQNIEALRNTIILTGRSGNVTRLKDIAHIEDRREELDILSRLNGEKSITFSISKSSSANSMDVIEDVKTMVETFRAEHPSGINFSFTNDNSIYIMRIINVLRNNALSGMLLIMFVLYLFLGKRNALLASLGIPISFFITFILMHALGYSLNGNTLFALVMVLGIIVDDAIIVVENAHRYRLMGYNSREAAVRGTMEVAKPILSSIGTNIAAFLPLMLLGGIMGKFMRIIPLVFSLALVASLFEAFFLLPSHYADWTKKSKTHKKGEKVFFIRLRKYYSKLLIKTLRNRYILLPALILVFFLSLLVIPYVGINMFGSEDMDQFKVLVKMPEGASLEESNRIMQKFEEKALEMPQDQIESVIVNVGLLQGNEEWVVKKSVGQIMFQMKPAEERPYSTTFFMEQMREKCKNISGPSSVSFEEISGGPPTGKPISVKVQGKYLDEIKAAALVLQDSLKTFKGAYDVSDDFPPGKKEVRIVVDEDKAALYGFNAQYVAANVRYAFDGVTATEYRDGDDEVDVIVKFGQKDRSSLDDILYLKMTNTRGETVALREMVKFIIKPGPTEIKRIDRKRTIFVTGNINEEMTTIDKINNKLQTIFPEIEQNNPGINFKIGGQFEEFLSVFNDILPLFALGMIIIFLILGTQFNSYAQPLLILTTVPFSLIGAMLGLLISGNPFSIIAMFGFVALAGVVVNDAIVMIDFINNRRKGKDTSVYMYWKSIINSGRLRLRPIILTSLTTISGLVPMAFGIGGISEMWSPLANVILFGLLISTGLTLLVIPSFMAILDDIQGKRKKALN
jgi:CzcA family heavy metal efflux pump